MLILIYRAPEDLALHSSDHFDMYQSFGWRKMRRDSSHIQERSSRFPKNCHYA